MWSAPAAEMSAFLHGPDSEGVGGAYAMKYGSPRKRFADPSKPDGVNVEAVRQSWLNRWKRMPKPTGNEPVRNYITPSGLQRLRDELRFLLTRERPAVTQVVAWAAGNGDRSENADYQYGKRRLRQIDGRIRFLTKRIDAARVVDPEAPRGGRAATLVFFGATVRYVNAVGIEREVTHRRCRRGRSGSSPHQLVVAAGARAHEVWTRRPRGASRASRHRSPADSRGAL